MPEFCHICGDDHMDTRVKKCPTCGDVKCGPEFGYRRGNQFQADCKECRKKYRRNPKPGKEAQTDQKFRRVFRATLSDMEHQMNKRIQPRIQVESTPDKGSQYFDLVLSAGGINPAEFGNLYTEEDVLRWLKGSPSTFAIKEAYRRMYPNDKQRRGWRIKLKRLIIRFSKSDCESCGRDDSAGRH